MKRIRSLNALAEAAAAERAVIVNRWGGRNCTAAFVINLQGRILNGLLKHGIYIYQKQGGKNYGNAELAGRSKGRKYPGATGEIESTNGNGPAETLDGGPSSPGGNDINSEDAKAHGLHPAKPSGLYNDVCATRP